MLLIAAILSASILSSEPFSPNAFAQIRHINQSL
jgi:hypothetical protein